MWPNGVAIRATSSTLHLNSKTWCSSMTMCEAERLIESCEHCNRDGAEIPFHNILDRITDSDPSVTDYVLEQPAKCPNCRREVMEKTLVEPT
jgi:hypothetical protein